jgi:hypothetical protein
MKYILNAFQVVLLCALMLNAQQKQLSNIYKLDGNEIKYSIDMGANWERLKLPFDKTLTAFSWDAKAPDRLLLGTKAMVYRSSNDGATWHAALTGSSQFIPQVFSVSQKNPFRVYCAGTTEQNNTQTTEVYQSMDGGVNWQRVMVSKEPIELLNIDPDNPTQKITFSFPDVKQVKGMK